jgi:hypothetical protein
LAVTGTGGDFNILVARVSQKLSPTVAETSSSDTEQTIKMDVLKSSFSPNKFTLRKSVPVKWVINGKELNECNQVIVIPQYNMKIELKNGNQIIEFTPPESVVVPWSCWMGMIPGTLIDVDNETATTGKPTAIEDYQQRFVSEIKQLVQHLKHFYQAIWAEKIISIWIFCISAYVLYSRTASWMIPINTKRFIAGNSVF